MTRPFTGRHMAVIILAFFAVVVGVNLTMAVLATRTFGGTVVDNSYVASQSFNDWLSQARRQQASGLDARISLDSQRHIVLAVKGERIGPGARAVGQAEHPLGRLEDVPLRLVVAGPDHLRSLTPLPEGRWIVKLSLSTGQGDARLREHVQ